MALYKFASSKAYFLLVNVSVQRRKKGANDVIFEEGFGKIILRQENK